MELTAMSLEVFEYVKEMGGKVAISEICDVTGRAARSVGASVTDLSKKGLVTREKEAGEEDEKGKAEEITYVVLTPEGEATTATLKETKKKSKKED